MERGYIYGVVGATGAGKSQLLDDIERLAQGDGVSKRQIHHTGTPPEIIQLSQKMHYMVDMAIKDFVELYGECLEKINLSTYLDTILHKANQLCGEPICSTDVLTRLSGGQSRALMIAMVALQDTADIILLDEIENAGINRLKVLQTLIDANKIVLLITHDPLLALMANYRIVLKNGGIHNILERTLEEENMIQHLASIDGYINALRDDLRKGFSLKGEEFNASEFTME